MNLTKQLVTLADRYGELTERSRARVSTMVFNQGGRLDAYAAGDYIPSIRVFERAMLWFHENWPEGQEWPQDIQRPVPEAAQ